MFRALLLALLLAPQENALKAGFAEIDVSPAAGTRKIGWNNKNHGTSVLDPLYAKAAVFVVAMLVGMGAFELVERFRSRGRSDAADPSGA